MVLYFMKYSISRHDIMTCNVTAEEIPSVLVTYGGCRKCSFFILMNCTPFFLQHAPLCYCSYISRVDHHRLHNAFSLKSNEFCEVLLIWSSETDSTHANIEHLFRVLLFN